MGDRLATIDIGQKLGKGLCPFWGTGWAGSPCNTMWHWPRPTFVASWLIQPFGHKLCHFFGGAGSPSSTMWPVPRPTAILSGILIHPGIWPQQIWAENWELCPFGREAGFPSNITWPGLSPTSLQSFILIHPTVWPQYTNVTDRTDRRDRQTTVP